MKFQPNKVYFFRGYNGYNYRLKVESVQKYRIEFLLNESHRGVCEIKETESGHQYIEHQYGIVYA